MARVCGLGRSGSGQNLAGLGVRRCCCLSISSKTILQQQSGQGQDAQGLLPREELPPASDTRWLGQALAPDVCGEGQEGATGCKWGWAGGAGHSDICGHVPAGQVGSIGSVVLEEKKQVIISVWGGSVGSGKTAIYNSVLSVPLP